jgi:hypothetical protein
MHVGTFDDRRLSFKLQRHSASSGAFSTFAMCDHCDDMTDVSIDIQMLHIVRISLHSNN